MASLRDLGGLLFGVLNDLPAGAYWLLALQLALTTWLVRCATNPTVFALVAWPGTVAHELLHLITGLLLGAKPSAMGLFPKSLGNGRWQLGYVEFVNLRWWNAPWTAMAPMLLAPLSLVLTVGWVHPLWLTGDFTGAALGLYLCATLLQASWPSSTDFEVAFPGLVVLALLAAWLW